MLREVLYAKIHHARVTHCDPAYMGSITIDPDLLDAVGLVANEKVLVADVETGARFETYIFLGERGSGHVMVNGAAAHRTGVGHRVLVMSFCQLDAKDLPRHRPRVIICDEHNRIAERVEYPASGSCGDVVAQVI